MKTLGQGNSRNDGVNQMTTGTKVTVNPPHKIKNPERTREARAFWIFVSPWVLGTLLFTGGPMIASLILSFTKYDVISAPTFHGLQNYIQLFQNSLFYKSLMVTGYYVLLAVPFTIIGSLILAVLLNQKVKGQAFFRTFYYAPSIISGVSVAFLWAWLLNPDFGVVNSLLYDFFWRSGAWLVSFVFDGHSVDGVNATDGVREHDDYFF